MEYLFDTVNISDIRKYMDIYPITGITSNPSIIFQHGKIDFFTHFREIRDLIGLKRTMHIQVVSQDTDGILKDAETILEQIDDQVYIKIPVTEQGLKAIRILKQKKINVTGTAIYTKVQALTALESGADYVSLYYNRMENMDIDPCDVISTTAKMIQSYNYATKILGASFKNIGQVIKAFESGAHAVTVLPSVLHAALSLPDIQRAVDDFRSDWSSIYGNASISDLNH
jgi:TalC/MipB family fructose-6-phosphate aldolase